MSQQTFERTLEGTEFDDQVKQEILQAHDFASKAHAGQKRVSGEAYIEHPTAVAMILIGWQMDGATVMAGLLHDTVEDTSADLVDIEKQFGPVVAKLVDGVTKIGQIRLKSSVTDSQRSTENIRKLLLAMSQDIRVVMIKLADRLHNLQTLEYLTPVKQRKIAKESLAVFAPLADRLGMGELKAQIEDICFSYLDPTSYAKVLQLRKQKILGADNDYQALLDYINQRIAEVGIEADVATRLKHLYSIHRKMANKTHDIGSIYDIMAARVIVDEIKQCYEVLGIVHERYKPLIYRIKDFIAVPKPNGYQSLHTTVLSPSGSIFEVQIRTRQMHEEAEHGLAAHFYYDTHKQSKGYAKGQSAKLPKKLDWVANLSEWQSGDGVSVEEDDMLDDIFSNRIFVFSPLGDLYDLPEGSTPIDFAFAVHGQLGYRIRGAKVNNALVNLSHQLKNRDIVEILASKQLVGPSRDWLNFVVSAKAKNRIRSWFRSIDRDTNLTIGRMLLAEELTRLKLANIDKLASTKMNKLLEQFNRKSLDELYIAIGEGQIKLSSLVQKISNQISPRRRLRFLPKKAIKPTQKSRVEVAGDRSIDYELATCCSPKPADKIIARTSRGLGLIVHREDCRQINHNDSSLLPAIWYTLSNEQTYVLQIKTHNQADIIAHITKVLSSQQAKLVEIHSRLSSDNKHLKIVLKLATTGFARLNQIIVSLQAIDGVDQIRRR